MQWREKEATNAFQFFQKTCPFILLVWPSGELMSPFLSKCSGPGSAADRGLRVALASTQITGLDHYHGFWNMRLWASHVLAQGAGASDVVRDMWKLSWVYPAQPSLVPAGRESRHQDTATCIQTDKHGNPVSCVPTLILHLKCKVVGHAKNASCLPPPEPALAFKAKVKGMAKLASKVPTLILLKPVNRALLICPWNPRPSPFLHSIIGA